MSVLKPARCAFQPRLNPNTLLCCWNTKEGINLWVCSFIKKISEGKSEPAHPSLCYSMSFLTIGAQKAFLSGVRWLLGDHMLCSHYVSSISFCACSCSLSHSPFPSASVCPASRILLVTLVCAKVLPVLKTWMIVLTSGQRTSICDADQEQNWYLKKKKTDKAVGIKIESRRSPYPSLALASLLLW